MNRFAMGGVLCAVCLLAGMAAPSGDLRADLTARPLPPFSSSQPQDWIHSKPLQPADLKGKVVLLYFWTFDCWNSYRSFPWLLDLEREFAPLGLQVVGIHTPEMEHEKLRGNLEAKVRQFNVTHPVMMDNDFRYWRTMGNHAWPTFYLIARDGTIRYTMVGETHRGDRNAERFETALAELVRQ